MKFMQRAANSPPSPAAPSPTDEPSAKRRRVESASTPSKVNIDDLADKRAIQAALAGEEAKRQAALERQATEADDTRWVLSFEDQPHSATPPALALRVVQTGFAHLDASPSQARFTNDNSEDRPVEVGRRSFGRFNKVLEVCSMKFDIATDADTRRNSRIRYWKTIPSRMKRTKRTFRQSQRAIQMIQPAH